MPFAVGCSDDNGGQAGSGGSAGSGGTGGDGGSAGAGGGGGDGGSAGSGGSAGTGGAGGGTTVLPNGGTCIGDNSPCEIGCETMSCVQQCDGDLNNPGGTPVVCSASCPGGGCQQDCEDGATCNMTCDGGGCRQDCDDGNCTFTCTGGGCTT